jgi:putative transposase
LSSEQRREWIDWQYAALSITRQCALAGVPRTTVYYEPVAVSAADLELMHRLDAQYTRTPFYGSRRMTAWLRTQGYVVNRKRVTRLLALLGLAALVVHRRLS